MGLALDESTDADEVQKEQGFAFAIDKELLSTIGGVKVDFEENRFFGGGFALHPEQPIMPAGSCC